MRLSLTTSFAVLGLALAGVTTQSNAQPIFLEGQDIPRGVLPTALPITFEGVLTTMNPPTKTTVNGTVGRAPGLPSVTTTTEVNITRTKVNTMTLIQAMIDGGAFSMSPGKLDPKKMQLVLFRDFGWWTAVRQKSVLAVISPQLPEPVEVPEEFLTLRLATPVAYSRFVETLPRPNASATPSRSPFPYSSSFTQGGTSRNAWRGWIGIEGYIFGVPFDGAVKYSSVQRAAQGGKRPGPRANPQPITYPPIYLEEILDGAVSGFGEGFLPGPTPSPSASPFVFPTPTPFPNPSVSPSPSPSPSPSASPLQGVGRDILYEAPAVYEGTIKFGPSKPYFFDN